MKNIFTDKQDEYIEDNYEEYYDEDEYDDGLPPVGCRACGGPYPDCKDSCPIFDD